MSGENEDDDFKKLFAGGSLTGDLNIPKDLGGADAIQHADDAIDFEGEDELADDEELPDEEPPLMDEDEADEQDVKLPIFAGMGHGTELEDVPEPEGPGPVNYDDFPDDDDDWTKEFTMEGRRLIYDMEHDSTLPMDTFPDDSLPQPQPQSQSQSLALPQQQQQQQPQLYETSSQLQPLSEQELMGPGNMFLEDAIPQEQQLLQYYYPDFKPGAVLKMNSLFAPKATKLSLPKPLKSARQCVPTRAGLEVEVDQRTMFKSNLDRTNNANNIVRITNGGLSSNRHGENADQDAQKRLDKDLIIASTEWEVPELWKDGSSSEEESSLSPVNVNVNHKKNKRSRSSAFEEIYNSEDEEAFLNGTYNPVKKRVKLDMNDPNLLFVEDQKARSRAIKRTSQVPTSEKQLLQRYNVSNDRAYDMLKENYQSKVRSTIGNLTIDHSMVALRLQSPHYKAKLSKAQMRSHHRPSFVVKPNTTITFAKVKQRKKKKDKGKHITQLLNKTSDLTLGDSAGFFMLEYSEEFPLVLSNFGMGSKLINYYRKMNAEDTSRPKRSVGETHVLSVQDRSAFWNFGFVEPGNVVPTLYNRMIRAPIFQHKPLETDFLLVRTTGGGQGQRYFLRTIPYSFVVGQTFPVTTIPGPHSRKVTTASKNRLKMVVYRVLNQNPRHRLLVKDVSAHFPDQNDMQNRQRLKEFMEFQRSGEDQGFWKVKASEPLPSEESIRAMISPEDITLLEAMQVGQQRLEDAGYGKTVDDDNDDQDGMSIEEQLAPWNITRNFINATQGKAMLQLHGEGDPSGRGEAFSFLRTSMKGGFKAQGESFNERVDKSKFGGHSYNVALQQKAYDEEIARIWYTQKRSLQVTNTDDLGWDEAESKRDNDQRARDIETPAPEDEGMSMFSHDSATTSATSGHKSKKVLRITRFVKDKNGTRQRRVEIVRDANVIRAYIKRRQKNEDAKRAESLAAATVEGFSERLKADNIAPSTDAEQHRRNKKILEVELARLQRNQDRRNARKALKVGTDPTQPQSGKGIGKGKSTTRKCATCGEVGHIRTNKSCPLYNERFGGSEMPPPPPKV